jgi:SAM-dependent methyltransferase
MMTDSERAQRPAETSADYDWKLKKEAEFWGQMARVRSVGGIPMTMDFSRATRYRVRRASLGWGDYFQDPTLERLIPYGRARNAFVRTAREAKGENALDLGCGAGWLALEEARSGKTVDAIDISAEEIEVAKNYQAGLEETVPGSINWTVGDLNSHSLAENKYDLVTAWDALHHVEQMNDLCERIYRSLKPGGVFLLGERVWGSQNPSVRARISKYLEQFVWTLVPTPAPYTYRRKLRELGQTMSLVFRTKVFRRKHVSKPWQIQDEGYCSPFEEASGAEIVDFVKSRFSIEVLKTYGGFTEEIVRSIYLPRVIRIPVVMLLAWLDHLLVRVGLLEGKIAIVYARKSD